MSNALNRLHAVRRLPDGFRLLVLGTLPAFAFLAVACQQPRSSQEDQGTASPCASLSGPELLALLHERLLADGHSRATVRAQRGEPESATTTPTPNRHLQSQIDTLVRWTYDSSEFLFLVVRDNEFLLERRVSVEHPAVIDCQSRLSTPEASTTALGASTWTDTTADTVVNGHEVRAFDDPAPDVIALHYLRGRLIAVAVVPYVD